MSDRCPFVRPFTEDFDGCAAYQPILFEPVDIGRRPLREAWTCRNLEAGTVTLGRFYPRCRLGTPDQRARWAARHGDRARRLSDLRRHLVRSVEAELQAFLAIQRAGGGQVRHQSDLRAAGQRLIDALHAELGRQGPQLDAIGLDRGIAAGILRDMVVGWEASLLPVVTLDAPPELIARYPAAKDLLAPG